MGYPVVASIFGHQAVFYAAVLNVVNTFAVFTIGTILVVGDLGDGKRFQKKVLYSTPMLSAYLAMLIVALGIDNIPGLISQPLTNHRVLDVTTFPQDHARQSNCLYHDNIPTAADSTWILLSVRSTRF